LKCVVRRQSHSLFFSSHSHVHCHPRILRPSCASCAHSFTSLTLERVDLDKRIDSARRIISCAADIITTNTGFSITAVPDPTPEQVRVI
jgi:hypothetical protein